MKVLTCLAWVLFPAALLGCGSSGEVTASSGPAATAIGGEKVTVYYFHRTFRCFACTNMEKMAAEALREELPRDLATGAVRWRTVDYPKEADLARRFGVDFPTLVVTVNDRGRIASYRRLDDAWELKDDSQAFRARLVAAVQEAMSGHQPPAAGSSL